MRTLVTPSSTALSAVAGAIQAGSAGRVGIGRGSRRRSPVAAKSTLPLAPASRAAPASGPRWCSQQPRRGHLTLPYLFHAHRQRGSTCKSGVFRSDERSVRLTHICSVALIAFTHPCQRALSALQQRGKRSGGQRRPKGGRGRQRGNRVAFRLICDIRTNRAPPDGTTARRRGYQLYPCLMRLSLPGPEGCCSGSVGGGLLLERGPRFGRDGRRRPRAARRRRAASRIDSSSTSTPSTSRARSA